MTEAIKKVGEDNLGIGFVCRYAVERERSLGDLRIIPIERFELTCYMELIYRRQKYFSPVAQRFCEFVHAYSQQHLSSLGLT